MKKETLDRLREGLRQADQHHAKAVTALRTGHELSSISAVLIAMDARIAAVCEAAIEDEGDES